MTGARTLSGAEREPPLSPPDHDDPPSAKLSAFEYDRLAGDFLRDDCGGSHAQAFDSWLEAKGYA